MLTIRRAADRGHADHGWVDSCHTFSFANYYDPAHVGFRSLLVINEDRVQGGRGFGAHPHRDMEIISYVLEGGLAHRDSLGNGSIIRPGEVQRMSAGTGVTHSELNASQSETVHFLQIWIQPAKRGIAPSYEQKGFDRVELAGRLRLLASPDGSQGSVQIHADVRLYAGLFEAGERCEHGIPKGRHAFVHVARGAVRVMGERLEAGDAVAISDEASVLIDGVEAGEVLVFDLA
jgi:redox-sensitive bicupin YhaK (pirin superfamily)